MKIKKVENKEKPEYDTKTEKQNKFLKLIFEHKKITITLVVLTILTCGALIAKNWYDSQDDSPEIVSLGYYNYYYDDRNKQIEVYSGTNVKGSEVRTLIGLINQMNKQDYFPEKLTIKYLSEPQLKIVSGDSYLTSWLKFSDYYTISVEYEYGYGGYPRYVSGITITKNTPSLSAEILTN